MSSNRAAYLISPRDKTLQVKEAPYPKAGPDEIVLKTSAVAINPMEWKIQDYNPPIGGQPLNYPLVMGSDVAGTIAEVGSNVTTRKVGQRVILNAHGIATRNASHSGFQQFVVAGATHTIPIPDALPLEQAVVLPLALDTAAAGLFGTDQLNLSLSKLTLSSSTTSSDSQGPSTNKTVLIWGGSSSVGCCAIQLARAAGYTVFTTASAHNHELCRSIGAARVFDHSATDVEAQIVAALTESNATIVGALDCIADKNTTMPVCARILSAAAAGTAAMTSTESKKETEVLKLVTVLSPPEEPLAEAVRAVRLMIPTFVRSEGYWIVREWLGRALADGSMKCRPEAKVVGQGLESVQKGIDLLRQGVSASKLVVLI